MASDHVRGYAAWRDERAKVHRVELATRMMESLIAGRRGPVEPGLWATAFMLADAMPTFRDATVPHEEPALSDLIVMPALSDLIVIEHAEPVASVEGSAPPPMPAKWPWAASDDPAVAICPDANNAELVRVRGQ